MVYGTSTYGSWNLLISYPEEIRNIHYLILVFWGIGDIETTITNTNNSVPQKLFFPSIPLYALRNISRDGSEKFPITDSGVDAEHLTKLPGFLRIFLGTKLI